MNLATERTDKGSLYDSIPDRSECLPPLPFSLLKLLEIIRDENASEADIEEVLRHDEALSAKILQMSNSAYYGMRGSVCTLGRAIMTMGIREVKSLCLCFLILNQLPSGSPAFSRERMTLWKHSLAVALLANRICARRPWVNTEKAFALGLLHDLGLLVLMSHLPDTFEDIRQIAEANKVGFLQAELLHGLTHSRVGGWLAVKWGLPEDYRLVMKHHHAPEESPALGPIVKLIHLADALSRAPADTGGSNRTDVQRMVAGVCADLVISNEELEQLLSGLDTIRKDVDRLWSLLAG